MDDSERSYGYSQDIYHGRRPHGAASEDAGGVGADEGGDAVEASYEYGGEEGMGGELQDGDVSPELATMHIEGGDEGDRSIPRAGHSTGSTRDSYDFGRDGESDQVDSFTWENPTSSNGEERPLQVRKDDRTPG